MEAPKKKAIKRHKETVDLLCTLLCTFLKSHILCYVLNKFDLRRTTERPLITYYLLPSTIIILKKAMYLLCANYVPNYVHLTQSL